MSGAVQNDAIDEDDILGIECKHVCYTKGTPPDRGMVPDDLVTIKEVVHLKDGRQIPRVRLKKNFRRPFYVTKPGFRNHEEKKEWEDIDKLDKFECTQAALESHIKRALNIRSPVFGLRKISRTPYLYGPTSPPPRSSSGTTWSATPTA